MNVEKSFEFHGRAKTAALNFLGGNKLCVGETVTREIKDHFNQVENEHAALVAVAESSSTLLQNTFGNFTPNEKKVVKALANLAAVREGEMTTTEKFAIRQDPSNSSNWGIIWETSGTEGGYTSEDAARKSALKQNGTEAATEETKIWNW